MLEPKPRFDVKPRPMPEEMLDDHHRSGAGRPSSLEDTLSYALERDHFAEKQRDFMQQDLIAGHDGVQGLLEDRAPGRDEARP